MNYPNNNMPMPNVNLNQVEMALRNAGIALPVTVQVIGTVSYSHIHTKVEGQELERVNEKNLKNGRREEKSPYYALYLENPTFIIDPSLPKEVRAYLEKKVSHKEFNGEIRHTYFGKSTSKFAMRISYADGVAKEADAPTNTEQMKGELESGLQVAIGVSIFNTKNGAGCGMNEVILMEPIRYRTVVPYSSNSPTDSLKAINALKQSGQIPAPQQMPQPTQNVPPQAAYPMAGAQAPMQQPMQPNYGQPVMQPNYGQPQAATTQQAGAGAPPVSSDFMTPPAGDPAYGQGAPAPGQPGLTYLMS